MPKGIVVYTQDYILYTGLGNYKNYAPGEIYKCLYGVGRSFCRAGSIFEGYKPNQKIVQRQYISDKCYLCELFPFCLGGCRYDAYQSTGSFEGTVCKKSDLERLRKIKEI